MPTQVKLAQMVDLALGTPEVGAVNFNVLHALLHAMLRKLNIVEVQAEISEFDRDFLSSSKSRQISALSDLDSGKGDDSEDALSEKSSSAGRGPRKSTPYHRLEVKVEKIAEQLEQFNNDLPKYKELFEKSSDTPVADIWKYIQMQGDVETNKKGLAEVWKLVQEMMVNMKKLEDENKKLLEKINGLNMDDLNRRLKELEDKTNDLNEKFKQLPAFPTEEEWAQFVTWPGLEDALTGVKKDWENIQPPERVVIEMSSQTEPVSRPASSRPSTRMSSSPGPSVELLDILEKLGNLTASHEALTKRVEDLEEEMKNKLDKSALENFDLSSDLLQQLGKLKEDLDALALAREKDSDALSRAQQAILQLQAEVERLHTITKEILEDNQERAKQLQDVFQYCDKLQDTKADKEYVQMEVDVKADKRSLDNKVNHSLFDATTNDINRMIKEILDKLAGNEETWNSTIKKFADDIDGKLDRLELDPLKEWLESRLKALNDKLRKQQAQVEWTEDDAAGIRKQLIQRFHCISCDRPVDLVPTGVVLDPVPALPSRDALPPTRSPRPYTTFELDQIRQHAKSFASTEVSDYYATTRPCGGSHTMTYPHKRITRLSHLSHLFREEDGTVYPIYKEEVDVQGADGHIYKGRMAGKLEAKLPIVPQDRSKSPIPMSQRRTTVSPPPGHKAVHHHRPSSARLTPRRANGQSDSRPQSAHPGGSRQGTPGPDQSPQPVPAPPESPNLPDVPPVDQAPIEVPISSES